MSKILLRRGNKTDLPALNVGEPGFATDTKELFIGASGGNTRIFSTLSGGGKIQIGTGSVVVAAAGTTVTVTITFPVAFNGSPIGFATFAAPSVSESGYVNIRVAGAGTNAASMGVAVTSYVAQTVYFNWIAIGN